MNSVLHIGVLIDSNTPAAWIVQILHAIESHDFMRLTVFIQPPASPTQNQGSNNAPKKKQNKEHNHRQSDSGNKQPLRSLDDWIIYKVIDHPQFTHDPWRPQPIPSGITATTVPHKAGTSDLQSINACDVAVHLASQPLAHSLYDLTTPVWSAELPSLDLRIKRCLLQREPFIWIHLWCGTERVASHSLPCQTYSISDLRRLTYSALPRIILSRLIWLANSPEYKLDPIELQESRLGVFDKEIHLARQDADQALISKRLKQKNTDDQTTGGVASFMAFLLAPVVVPSGKAAFLALRKTYERTHHKLFAERWQLAIAVHGQPQTIKDISETPVHEFTGIDPAGDVMWADPHLCEHEGDIYVFFERMHAPNENAHIAWVKLNEQGKPVADGTALQTEFHLSFPFIFKHDNIWYMIPETASQRSVSLYRATRFPDQWEFHSTLLEDINAADTVVFEHENRWWMFTNCQSHRSVDERDELHVYYADTPQGPWQPHVLNPVLTGVDRSRMAGPVMVEKGVPYRPSQYGAYRYGYGINISRIDQLTPLHYQETAEFRILPDSGAGWSGCHSLGRIGNISMIDRVRFSRR